MRRSELERKLAFRVSRNPALRIVRDTGRDLDVPVWLVGGMVRDVALGDRPKDVDLVSGRGTRRLIGRLREILGTGGFRFRKRGVTTWRFSLEDGDLDIVDASRRGLEADLLRREFTLNAIAFDLRLCRIEDPAGGLRDLNAGILRLPRPGVVLEDPVRAVRAARFLARHPAMRLHRGARIEAASAANRLRKASVERIRDELDALLTARAPRRGLQALERLGLLKVVLPELLPVLDCAAGRDRPTVWEHTLQCLAESARYRRRPASGQIRDDPDATRAVRWALLLHDISKPETLDLAGERPTFHGHEAIGALRADAVMRRLLLPRSLRRRVRLLILCHLRPYQLAESGMPARGMRRLVRDAGEDLPALVVHAACDALGSGSPDARSRWRKLRRTSMRLLDLYETRKRESPEPLVGGDDVLKICGIEPGPAVGRILSEIEELRDEGRIVTRKAALAHLRSGRCAGAPGS